MRDLLFRCPECHAGLAFDRKLSGKQLGCPACKAQVQVPLPDTSFACPTCQAELHVKSDETGEFGCPSCDSPIIIEGGAPPIDHSAEERTKLDYGIPRGKGVQCPKCHEEIAENAVVCIACGFDRRTGKTVRSFTQPHKNGRDIALWPPVGATNMSLFVSPALSAWFHAANWEALGQGDKANASKVWFWVFVILELFWWITPREIEFYVAAPALVLLIIWYYVLAKTQQNHIKDIFGKEYRKLSFFSKPFWVAVGCKMVLVLAYFTIFSSMEFGMLFGDHLVEKSAVPIVSEILKENGEGTTCISVKLGEKRSNGSFQATATLADGKQLAINIEEKGNQIEVTIPAIFASILEKEAAPIVSSILKEQFDDDSKCLSVQLGEEQAKGRFKAIASLTDGYKLAIVIEIKDDNIEVTTADISAYLEHRKNTSVNSQSKSQMGKESGNEIIRNNLIGLPSIRFLRNNPFDIEALERIKAEAAAIKGAGNPNEQDEVVGLGVVYFMGSYLTDQSDKAYKTWKWLIDDNPSNVYARVAYVDYIGETCNRCSGSGAIHGNRCQTCNGEGVVLSQSEIKRVYLSLLEEKDLTRIKKAKNNNL